MTTSPTLNSRLRVLIAKTFRAERLYSSIRNTGARHGFSLGELSELANDVRAEVWQQAHSELRTELNRLLAQPKTKGLAQAVAALRDDFSGQAKDAKQAIEKSQESLLQMAKRQEFAHTFRLSLDLVRLKAHTQAYQVVADELDGILQASGRSNIAPVALSETNNVVSESPGQRDVQNVVPFKPRKVSSHAGR